MLQNIFLLAFAIINVIVVAIFAGTILLQYRQKRREYQLYWAIGLLMAFVATLSYLLMMANTSTSSTGISFFRLYYTLGAALTPAWLGLGSIALVTGKRLTRTCFLLLCLASLLAVITISEAPINITVLAKIAGTPGTGILGPGAWLPTIIVLNSLGVLAVVGVAAYSGWKLLRRQTNVAGFHPINLLWANVLMLTGDLFNAAAGTLSRAFNLSSSFWLIMAIGWIIFYAGVLLTGRRTRTLQQTEPSAEIQKSASSVTNAQTHSSAKEATR